MQELAQTSLPPSTAASSLVPKAAAWMGFGDGSMSFLPLGQRGHCGLSPPKEKEAGQNLVPIWVWEGGEGRCKEIWKWKIWVHNLIHFSVKPYGAAKLK